MADDTKSAVATGAAGAAKATVTIQTVKQQQWSITQISIEMPTASAGVSCVMRKNGYLVTPMIPYGDAADGTPLPVLSSDIVTIEWAGANPGDLGRVYYIYDVVPYA